MLHVLMPWSFGYQEMLIMGLGMRISLHEVLTIVASSLVRLLLKLKISYMYSDVYYNIIMNSKLFQKC